MKRIVLIAPASLPIPATKGGAIETLVQHLIKENEKKHMIDFTVISPYEENAYVSAKEYSYTCFLWYKTTGLIEKIRNRINRHLVCPLKREPFYTNWQGFVINSLQKIDFDKVIVPNNIEFLPVLKKHIGHKDLICYLHNNFKLEKCSLDACSSVLSVSEFVKREAIRQTSYSEGKIKVLLNCIDREHFCFSDDDRKTVREKYGLKDEDVAVCFVGRIVEKKGVRHLVEAFKRLSAPHARLFIIGSLGGNFGELNRQYSPFVQNLLKAAAPLKDKVVFTGFIPNDEVHEILSAMDIAANPSLFYEAAPVSNVEHMGLGLPVITTNRGGIPEYVNADCGFILDADKDLTDQIYHALKKLVFDKSLRIRMGKAGLQNAKKFYCDQFFNKFVEILE